MPVAAGPEKNMELHDDRAWLLRSRFNPHPIAGALVIAEGEITFRIDDADMPDDSLAWLEARLGTDDLRERLERSEAIIAFSDPIAECEVTWPITGGGGTMVVETRKRRWVVSVEGRSGGPIQSTIGMVSGRRRARDWKDALAEAEASAA